MDLDPSPAAEPSADMYSLDAADLERFLQRKKAGPWLPDEVDLGLQLRTILEKARQLVPSQAGSILLDDPLQKTGDRAGNQLCFVTSFGPASDSLPGTRMSASKGIAGKVYRTGEPHLAVDVQADASFSPDVDKATGYVTRSVVAAPITLGTTVCGLIELVDREGGAAFEERDLALLEIFAGYTSSTLQNALDAKRASELARRDDLSGLLNDRWLHHCLREMIEESAETGEPCALVFFDLDHFKAVNDTHGHLAGSQVLREIGFLLRRTVTRERAQLARYGGDEFVIALPATGIEEARGVAEAVRTAIEGATFLARPHVSGVPAVNLRSAITASIGVAEYRPGSTRRAVDVEEQALLRRADTAMYAAKAEGKNCVVVHTE